jgi:hypothetical protein
MVKAEQQAKQYYVCGSWGGVLWGLKNSGWLFALCALQLNSPAGTYYTLLYSTQVSTAPSCQGLHIVEASRSHSDTPQSVGFLWTGDQTDENTWQHITFAQERHPCLRRDSNLKHFAFPSFWKNMSASTTSCPAMAATQHIPRHMFLSLNYIIWDKNHSASHIHYEFVEAFRTKNISNIGLPRVFVPPPRSALFLDANHKLSCAVILSTPYVPLSWTNGDFYFL